MPETTSTVNSDETQNSDSSTMSSLTTIGQQIAADDIQIETETYSENLLEK